MANKDMFTAEALQEQLTDLKAEILQLSATLSAKGKDAAERAGPALEETADTVRNAAQSIRDQGQAAVEVIRENPGTTASVAVTAGLIGLAIGYMLGATPSPSRWRA